jgi:outer membrane protein TolC
MKPIASILTVTVFFAACSAWAQSTSPVAQGQVRMLASAVPGGAQNPLAAGIPSGAPTPKVVNLTLKDAVEHGLRYNLGVILGQQSVRAAQSSRLRALSGLLPHLNVMTSETVQQVNLAAFGFSGFPGVKPIAGPFPVFDVRASLSQSLSLSKLSELRAGDDNLAASEHSYKNTRDLVALACVQLYMQAVAGRSRLEAGKAQLNTAKALHELAISRRSTGFVPGIEVLRAQVQMQAQQQRLLLAENDLAKQKLALAQAIGLPLGQEFELTDQIPFTPLGAINLEDAVREAYGNRGDYQSLLAQVKAAEELRKAAVRQRMPSLDVSANYGDIGQHASNSHGTFGVGMSLRIPIFQGRETESRILAADAQLEQQKADLESLRARIYYEIRNVFLDLKTSEERVMVAKSNLDLAGEQVRQAQDRFAAGVASNIEVVQAQDALAMATEDHISSQYAHNIAKAVLAEAMGLAESGYEKFLRGK